MQKKFKEGKIEKEEFRRVLVGKNRLEFDIQVTFAEKMKEKLRLRIQKLRQQIAPPTDLIENLEAKGKELEESHQMQERFKQQAINI